MTNKITRRIFLNACLYISGYFFLKPMLVCADTAVNTIRPSPPTNLRFVVHESSIKSSVNPYIMSLIKQLEATSGHVFTQEEINEIQKNAQDNIKAILIKNNIEIQPK